MQQLNGLQQQLEQVYAIDSGIQVTDFVITDPALAQHLDTSDHPRSSTEKLLVQEDDEGLALSLYLDEALLSGWQPAGSVWQHDDLADFCTILEGISHFVCLCWNAQQGRSISCLELEMQAEVDKYIILVSALSCQEDGLNPKQLHDWLFEQPNFDHELSQSELIRYRDANHFAAKYCHQLAQQHFRRPHLDPHTLHELRCFYRLSLRHKVRRITLGLH